jgi:hypothetical protein
VISLNRPAPAPRTGAAGRDQEAVDVEEDRVWSFHRFRGRPTTWPLAEGSGRPRAERMPLSSSAVAEASKEKHKQEDDENPRPDRHRSSSFPSALSVATRLPRSLTRLFASYTKRLP